MRYTSIVFAELSKKCLWCDLGLAVPPNSKKAIQKYQEENLKILNNQGGI